MQTASRADNLICRVIRRIPMHYRGGSDPSHDRPRHVRAASGLTVWRGQLAVVSDDANFIAIVDHESGECQPWTLPAAADGRRQFDKPRGNKADKLDLESVFVLDDALIALGSDSGLAVRRQAAIIDAAGVRLLPLPRWYQALRDPALGAGVLNVEAATVQGDDLVIGNRGGDIGSDGVATLDAIARVPLSVVRAVLSTPDTAAIPHIVWTAIDLGWLDETRLRLTDLEAWDHRLAFVATAEATSSAYDDGAVIGSAIGAIDHDRAWLTAIVDHTGAAIVDKVEGLARLGDRWFATVDADDPDRASDLLELAFDGT
jgi:hypothetical protein